MTVFDIMKAVDRRTVVTDVPLLEKRGASRGTGWCLLFEVTTAIDALAALYL
jgi:hypothetical protein